MAEAGLIPNKSYEIFVLGDSISNYLHLPHKIESYDHTYIMTPIISIISILKFGLKMAKLKQLNVIKSVIGKAKI